LIYVLFYIADRVANKTVIIAMPIVNPSILFIYNSISLTQLVSYVRPVR